MRNEKGVTSTSPRNKEKKMYKSNVKKNFKHQKKKISNEEEKKCTSRTQKGTSASETTMQ